MKDINRQLVREILYQLVPAPNLDMALAKVTNLPAQGRVCGYWRQKPKATGMPAPASWLPLRRHIIRMGHKARFPPPLLSS